MSTKERIDVYQIVTDKVITMLEAGTVPWHKPWRSKSGQSLVPHNLISGKAYRGVNLFLLSYTVYNNPYWLTFKQAQSRGATVRKGERGTQAVFWKMLDAVDPLTGKAKIDSNGKPKKIPMLRYYTIFNAEQCDDLETPYKPDDGTEATPFNVLESCEAILANWKDKPTLTHGGNRVCYNVEGDKVNMPEQSTFESTEAYYATLFHEYGHATGHKSRLNREFGVRFGSDQYAKEELVAEMTSAFLCAFSGIDSGMDQSAAYLQGWLKELKNDRKLIVNASAAAQKAADYIMAPVVTAAESEEA